MINPRIQETPEHPASARTSDYGYSSPAIRSIHVAAPQQTEEAFKVYIRIRPTPTDLSEHQFRTKEVLTVENSMVGSYEYNQVTAQDPFKINSSVYSSKKFSFDSVFGQEAGNAQVYDRTLKPLIPYMMEGFNTCCFAFGMTGAGKTHTMLGNTHTKLNGLVQLATHDIFAGLQDYASFQCRISYLEIYNEQVVDLLRQEDLRGNRSPDVKRRRDLSPLSRAISQTSTELRRSNSLTLSKGSEKRSSLKIHEDPQKGVFVKNLTSVEVHSLQEVQDVIQRGNKMRTMAPTYTNQFSSRSHAVLQIQIEKPCDSMLKSAILSAKLSLIDLAGSERGSSAEVRSQRMLQGSNINKSLLALCNCITILSECARVKHVPYRDSKLTYLLKDSLGGKTRTAMIACVSALAMHYEESLSTLKYAERARKIKADKLVRNLRRAETDVSHFASVIQNLETEITELKKRFSERFNSLPPPQRELVVRVRGATHSFEKSSTFYLSRSDSSKAESGRQFMIESVIGSQQQSEEAVVVLREKNCMIIERISGFLEKNIQEYVETNRTLNDIEYDEHILRVNLKRGDLGERQKEEVEEEIAMKEMIKEELKESLEINLKQRNNLQKMLTTLTHQNSKNLKENARAFHFENIQLKLKNIELKIQNRRLENENRILTNRKQRAEETHSNMSDFPSSSRRHSELKSDPSGSRPVFTEREEQEDDSEEHNSFKYFQLHQPSRGQLFLQDACSPAQKEDALQIQRKVPTLDTSLLSSVKLLKFNDEEEKEQMLGVDDKSQILSWNRKSIPQTYYSPLQTLRTNEEGDFEFNINSIVTPLPDRNRIVPAQNQLECPKETQDVRKPRTQNSITLTVPLQGANQQTQRMPGGAKAKLKLGARDKRAETSPARNMEQLEENKLSY